MPSSHPPIELEVRGEIKRAHIPTIEKRLRSLGFKKDALLKRTSVMSFGRVTGFGLGGKNIPGAFSDIRARITNSKAEIVAKIGEAHAHNRMEISQSVSLTEMVAFARMFAAMGFFTKVGSRTTQNYTKGPITVSLVWSKSGLAYIEIEKMSTRQKEQRDHEALLSLAKIVDVTLWTTKEEYVTFCDQFTVRDDWAFAGTDTDAKRLLQEIKTVKSGKK